VLEHTNGTLLIAPTVVISDPIVATVWHFVIVVDADSNAFKIHAYFSFNSWDVACESLFCRGALQKIGSMLYLPVLTITYQ